MPIGNTTLRGIKVHAAIAGNDFIGPAKPRDAVFEFFMKPRGKPGKGHGGEKIFKPGQIDLAVVINTADLKRVKEQREQVYELDDNDIVIRRKVCIYNLAFIDASHSPH